MSNIKNVENVEIDLNPDALATLFRSITKNMSEATLSLVPKDYSPLSYEDLVGWVGRMVVNEQVIASIEAMLQESK